MDAERDAGGALRGGIASPPLLYVEPNRIHKMKICPRNNRYHRSITATALRALVAVADEGSFRRAAERLGYTQSAISHQVAVARARARRLALPPPGRPRRGHADAPPARSPTTTPAARCAALATLDVEVRAAQRGERETLRDRRLPDRRGRAGAAGAARARRAPSRRRGRAGRERAPRGRRRRARRAAGSTSPSRSTPSRTTRSRRSRCCEDPWVILTWRGSPLADAQRPTLDLLDGVQVVAWGQHWQTQVELEELWRRRGIAPRVVYRTDDSVALQRLVAARPRPRLRRAADRAAPDRSRADLGCEPREVLPARTIALCHARGRRLSAAAQALIEIVREQQRGLSAERPSAASPRRAARCVAISSSLRRSSSTVIAVADDRGREAALRAEREALEADARAPPARSAPRARPRSRARRSWSSRARARRSCPRAPPRARRSCPSARRRTRAAAAGRAIAPKIGAAIAS